MLLLTYTGSLELNEPVQAALSGGETRFEDHYYRTHVRLESGDERYAWVNRTLFVGRGRILPDGVVYEVYRVPEPCGASSAPTRSASDNRCSLGTAPHCGRRRPWPFAVPPESGPLPGARCVLACCSPTSPPR